MSTPAHCIFCFETLSANLEHREALRLEQIEELWQQYSDALDEDETRSSVRHNSNVSQNDNKNSTSSLDPSPMFITWNTISSSGNKRLRGCIGTFAEQEVEHGLQTYALVSALEDHRFRPISTREIPSLECKVTLLTDFEDAPDKMAWEIGTHGIRISFSHKGKRYGSTYLPDVAVEQGWTKEEALISLMHKAGWSGRDEDWTKIDLHVVRYQGHAVGVSYKQYKDFKDWISENNGTT